MFACLWFCCLGVLVGVFYQQNHGLCGEGLSKRGLVHGTFRHTRPWWNRLALVCSPCHELLPRWQRLLSPELGVPMSCFHGGRFALSSRAAWLVQQLFWFLCRLAAAQKPFLALCWVPLHLSSGKFGGSLRLHCSAFGQAMLCRMYLLYD